MVFSPQSPVKKKSRQIHPDTLLIVRFDLIGDYILFRNFLTFIRKSAAYQNYRITLCGNVVFRNLAESLDAGFVDDFIWVDRTRFIKDKAYHYKVLKNIHDRGFDVVVQPTFSREIYGDLLVNASRARRRIGVDGDLTNQSEAQKKIADSFYTKLIRVEPSPMFEFFRNREIVEKIIEEPIPLGRPRMDLPHADAPSLVSGEYAVLAPGASHRSKQWEDFHRIADYLADRYNLKIVLAGRGKLNRKAIQRVLQKSTASEVINLCDRTSLMEAAYLLARARLVVSNDTAAVHLAAVLGVRTVCVSSGTHLFRFNNYPEDFGFRIRFIFPPQMEDLRATEDWKQYSAEYSTHFDINSIPTTRAICAIDEVMNVDN